MNTFASPGEKLRHPFVGLAASAQARRERRSQIVDAEMRDWAVMERHAAAVLDKFGIQGWEREEFSALRTA